MTAARRTTPLVCASDNRAELHAAAETARIRRRAAEASIALAEAADDSAAYDRAEVEFDRHDDELLLIERRIEEVEEDAAFDEIRERRREPAERNERLHKTRDQRSLDALHWLVVDLSAFLTDEGDHLTPAGLDALRRRVANALPPTRCPEWLAPFRDPPIVRSAGSTP